MPFDFTALDLPITQIIEPLRQQLNQHNEAILEAEPGAGKTTLVPLALLDQPWLKQQKILVLEPRRLAAKHAAARMAELLKEPLGKTVGYRIRHEQKVSQDTRIEVITEGILVRLLQDDPSLEGIGLIIFDEFHERNLDSDLALALCLESRDFLREEEPLKLLIMSATLEQASLEKALGCRRLFCPGRSFPVRVNYQNLNLKQDEILPHLSRTVCHALSPDEVDNAYMEKQIKDMRRNIEKGDSLLRVSVNSTLFSPLVLQMVAVGEETGRVDELLKEVADYYEREVDFDLKSLTAKIEPVLIGFVAVMVGGLALGIFTPMWDMMSAFKG